MILSTKLNTEEKLEKPTDIKINKNSNPHKKPKIKIPVKDINNNYIQIQILKLLKNQKSQKKGNINPNISLFAEKNKDLFKKNLSNYEFRGNHINFANQSESSYIDDKIDKISDYNDISLNELKVDLDLLSSNTSYIGDDEKNLCNRNMNINNNNAERNTLLLQGKINNMNSQVSASKIMNLQRLNNFNLNQKNLNQKGNFRNNDFNNNAIFMNNVYNSKNYLQTMILLNNLYLFKNNNTINDLNQLNYVNNNSSSLNLINNMNPFNNMNMINNENVNIINQVIKNKNILNFVNRINHQNKLKEFNIVQKFKEKTPNGVKVYTIQCKTTFIRNNDIITTFDKK